MSQAGQIIMGLALVAACTGAGAQTVYRCGSAYSQAPCTGGQGIDNPETPQTPRAQGSRQAEQTGPVHGGGARKPRRKAQAEKKEKNLSKRLRPVARAGRRVDRP